MKALRFERHGDPSVLFIAELPALRATAHTAVVEIHAASINPSDVKNVAGRMSQTTLPRTPGRDYSGIVIDGPTQWLGAEVWGSGGDIGFTRDGSHAEQLAVPISSLRRKPQTLSHEQAASIGVNFVTAWCALVEAAKLGSDDTVAIIGLGGVGNAAAQIARRAGAKVIGVARHSWPNPYVDVVVDSTRNDAAANLQALTGGGASVVFDTVGGSMFETALQLLRVGGRLIEISASDRRQVSFDLADFYHNESRLIGVDTLKRDMTAAAAILEALRPGFDDGSYLPPAIAQRLPLSDAANGYENVFAGTTGRVVLTPLAGNVALPVVIQP